MKKCSKCRMEKDESEFYRKDATRLKSECKVCFDARMVEFRKGNADLYRDIAKKKYDRDPKAQVEANRRCRERKAAEAARQKADGDVGGGPASTEAAE